MMQVFYHGDGYPAFPIHIALLEKAVRSFDLSYSAYNIHTSFIQFVSILGGYIAPLLGYRLKYESLKQL